MSKPNKYNASGMGAQPKLNDNQLYNGPSRPGGSQTATPNFTCDNNLHPGDKGSSMSIRETPLNQHGHTGRVEPGPGLPQPDGSVRST